MEYWERVNAAIEHAGGNAAAIAREIEQMPGGEHFKQNMFSQFRDRKSQKSKYTHLIAEACGVDPHWLATGQGEMITDDIMAQAYDIAFIVQDICNEKGIHLPRNKMYDIVESVLKDTRENQITPSKSMISRRVMLVVDNAKK